MKTVCKIVGLILIFLACLLLGDAKGSRLKRRYEFYTEMVELLLFMKRDMLCHHSVLDAAMREAIRYSHGEAGMLFQKIIKRNMSERTIGFRMLWEEEVRRSALGFLLQEEEIEELVCVADALCNTDLKKQEQLMDKCVSRFEKNAAQEWQVYKEKGDLYRKLGLAAGCFFLIIFY